MMNDRFEKFTVLINRINRNIRKIENHEMINYNLRNSHISCLYYLYLFEELTSTELCEKCEEDKATISRSINFLEKGGYLKYDSQGRKKYKTPIVLTEKGREAGKRISDKVDSVLDEVSLELSEDERKSFYQSLTAISERLERISNRCPGTMTD